MYFKATLKDDELFLEAKDVEQAKQFLEGLSLTTGKNIPMDLVEWEALEELPEGKLPMTFENVQKSGKSSAGKSLL